MAMKMGPRERVSSVVRTGAILLLGGLGTVLDVLFVSCIPPWMCVPLPAVPIVLPLFPFFAGVFLIIAGLWRETEDAERRERTARERRSALTVSVTLLIALTLVVAWGLGAFGPPFGSQPGPFCGVIGPATNKPFGTFYLPNATTSAVEIAVASCIAEAVCAGFASRQRDAYPWQELPKGVSSPCEDEQPLSRVLAQVVEDCKVLVIVHDVEQEIQTKDNPASDLDANRSGRSNERPSRSSLPISNEDRRHDVDAHIGCTVAALPKR